MTHHTDATGLTFVLRGNAENIDDDKRPCVYCNPDNAVEEREYMAKEPTPPYSRGVTVGYTTKSNSGTGVVNSYNSRDGYHLTDSDTGEDVFVPSADITEFISADLPDDIGIIYADYIIRIGVGDTHTTEVPVCSGCLVDVPLEYGEQSAVEALDHRYRGNGVVGKAVTEEVDGRTVHQVKPVEEP